MQKYAPKTNREPNNLVSFCLAAGVALSGCVHHSARSHNDLQHHNNAHHDHYDGERELEARPLFSPTQDSSPGATLLMTYGSQPEEGPSSLYYHDGHVDVRYTTGRIKVEREIKRHEDFASKSLKAFGQLSAKASQISAYWDNRLKELGGHLDYLANRQDYGHYTHSITHWQDNAYKAEDYAIRAQDIRNKMASYGHLIQQTHLPKIKHARLLMRAGVSHGETDEMQRAVEFSRQANDEIVGLVRTARSLESDLQELESVTRADKNAQNNSRSK
ncbi:MAG: hypothetical protein HYT79_03565 [Elusimicrobia bacterium]|nr:hypothetical protein [Elusimicrobiota bacterium]